MQAVVAEHGTLSRVGIVLFVAGLALAIPDMADILAVVGALLNKQRPLNHLCHCQEDLP